MSKEGHALVNVRNCTIEAGEFAVERSGTGVVQNGMENNNNGVMLIKGGNIQAGDGNSALENMSKQQKELGTDSHKCSVHIIDGPDFSSTNRSTIVNHEDATTGKIHFASGYTGTVKCTKCVGKNGGNHWYALRANAGEIIMNGGNLKAKDENYQWAYESNGASITVASSVDKDKL